jgi:hypothetical protein
MSLFDQLPSRTDQDNFERRFVASVEHLADLTRTCLRDTRIHPQCKQFAAVIKDDVLGPLWELADFLADTRRKREEAST